MNSTAKVYAPDLDILEQYDDFCSLSFGDLKKIKCRSKIVNLKNGRSPYKTVGHGYLFYFISGEFEIKLRSGSYFINSQADANLLRKAFNERNDILVISATRHSSILCVEKNALYDLLSNGNMGEYLVEDLTDVNDDIEKKDWMQVLLATKIFRKIPPQNIQKLFSLFVPQSIGRGIRVISEGEMGDQFYVIKSGSAKVIRKDSSGQEQEVARLNAGDYFGEESLVGETTRNATVTMLSDGELMCLDKNAFRELLQAPVLESISLSNINQWSKEAKDVVLIDVRLPMEYRMDKKAGSINIPLSELRNRIPKLEESARYVVACNDGYRNRLAAYLLNEAGLDAYILAS